MLHELACGHELVKDSIVFLAASTCYRLGRLEGSKELMEIYKIATLRSLQSAIDCFAVENADVIAATSICLLGQAQDW